MSYQHPHVPLADRELLTVPDRSAWASLVEANRRLVERWDFAVGGMDARELRALVRGEALALGRRFSERLGVSVREPGDPLAPVVATGHQPELYHPGVWVKDFLLERLAEETGASAFDLVVDSDGFESVGAATPHREVLVIRRFHELAAAQRESCFAMTPVPGAADVAEFGRSVLASLGTLGSPSATTAFRAFMDVLPAAAVDARDLAEAVTFARRRYEAAAGTGYLELPVTHLCRSRGYLRFVVEIALNAERFATVYNRVLAEYRVATGARSAAQPVPDLRVDEGVELPFWALRDDRRRPVRVSDDGDVVRIRDGEQVLVEIPRCPDGAVDALCDADVLLAPKALAQTMFVRLFACDLFLHGTGGGRYDEVTDGIIRRYFCVEPPAFAVASATLRLPVDVEVVTADDVSSAKERLNRLEHHPETVLDEVAFETVGQRERAGELVAAKAEIVAAISQPGADRKALGLRIRDVNAELGGLLGPVRQRYERELEELVQKHAACEVLTDRTYPFCFWSPVEVEELVRRCL